MVFCLAGETASGKSQLAVELAERLQGAVVCADAQQTYRDMDIVSAAPDATLTARCAHYLYGVIDPAVGFDVAEWRDLFGACIEGLREGTAILTGGTGLYFRAAIQGLSPLPASNPALREELSALPPGELRERLKKVDPKSYAMIDLNNSRRVIRALEISLLAGIPASQLRATHGVEHSWKGAFLYRDDLQERIACRVDAMFAQGVVDEIQNLAPRLGPTASKAIGVRQILDLIAGRCSMEECKMRMVIATRQYAKRQRTWFRNQTALVFLDAARPDVLDRALSIF